MQDVPKPYLAAIHHIRPDLPLDRVELLDGEGTVNDVATLFRSRRPSLRVWAVPPPLGTSRGGEPSTGSCAPMFPLLMRHQRDAVEEAFAPVLSRELSVVYEPRLIHGDLGPYHVLCGATPAPELRDAAPRLVGVIDFGTAGLGDPAVDIGMLLHVYGESLIAHATDA